MDPLSALSVASSVIQIVDFSAKLINQISDLYTSETGEIKQYKQLRKDAEDLRLVNRHLHEALDPTKLNRQLTKLEAEVATLSHECDSAAVELSDALKSVSLDIHEKRKKKDLWKKWMVVQKAVKVVWIKKDIGQLKARLESAQQLLSTTILVNIQSELSTSGTQSQQTTGGQTQWDSAQSVIQWLDENRKDTNQWQANILDAVDRNNRNLLQAIKSASDDSMPSWTDTPVATTIMDKLLSYLQFPEMPTRYERIAEAFAETFEWVFHEPQLAETDHPWNSFRQWLEGSCDIYWITGKAGSGKSTLMKLIYNDPRTEHLLQMWRPGTQVVTAAFFFWNSGTSLQMSQTGMLRTILHQALIKRRQLVKESLPSKWEAFSLSKDFSKSWTWTELVQAFRFLVEEDLSPISYVFFIDGLDELDGPKEDLILLIRRLAAYPNVKICVSSRPWTIFEDAFGQQPSLILQFRTYGDIKHYVEENFLSHPGFNELNRCFPEEASHLMENISMKASGVFLWVVLVVTSLKEGFTDGDKLSDLQRRLESLPEELEELFRKMLYSQKPAYFKHASQLFRLFRAAKSRPTVLLLSFADEESDDYAFRRHVGPLHREELFYRAGSMKRRLDSRCKGLLEIPPPRTLRASQLNQDSYRTTQSASSPSPTLNTESDFVGEEASLASGLALANTSVEYLHRTVKDFFEQPAIWDYIVAADPDFNPSASLSRAYILLVKSLAPDVLRASETVFWDAVTWCMEHSYAVAKQDTDLHVRLLDELDSAASSLTTTVILDKDGNTLASTYGDREHAECHWTAMTAGGQPTDTFLTFAARCHLLDYVESKVTDSSLSDPERETICTELLYTVIAYYEVLFASSDRQVCMQIEPNAELADLLLSCGADPNRRISSQSPWQCLLKTTTEKQRERDNIWRHITKALQDHGAVTEPEIVLPERRQSAPNNGFLQVPTRSSLDYVSIRRVRKGRHRSDSDSDSDSESNPSRSSSSVSLHLDIPIPIESYQTESQNPLQVVPNSSVLSSQKTRISKGWVTATVKSIISRIRTPASKRSTTCAE